MGLKIMVIGDKLINSLLNSENYEYEINLNGISINTHEKFVSGAHRASIQTRKPKSYFPQFIYKEIKEYIENQSDEFEENFKVLG